MSKQKYEELINVIQCYLISLIDCATGKRETIISNQFFLG